jgi:ankyrin repeat protein
MVAVCYNFLDVVTCLLKRKDIDLNVASSNGTTPLMNSVTKGFYDTVSLLTLNLTSHNLNLNAQNKVFFPFKKGGLL